MMNMKSINHLLFAIFFISVLMARGGWGAGGGGGNFLYMA